MEITEVRITLKDEAKVKAFASVTFNDCFVLRGFKVISGSQGYFVSMPGRKTRSGAFQNTLHPLTNDMKIKINDAILDAFEKELIHQNQVNESISSIKWNSKKISICFDPYLTDKNKVVEVLTALSDIYNIISGDQLKILDDHVLAYEENQVQI